MTFLFDTGQTPQTTLLAIRTAFLCQLEGRGLSIVEILSSCPTNWRLDANAALDYIRDQVLPVYPLGDFKAPTAGKADSKEG